MIDRNCDKCVHHQDGGCTQWECKGTVTVNDVERKAIKEFSEWIKDNHKIDISEYVGWFEEARGHHENNR